MPCPNCGQRKVSVTTSDTTPGKHYHCNKCDHNWEDRTLRRYQQRKILTSMLLERLLEQKGNVSLRDRFFIEKMRDQGKSGLKYHNRLLRIANKIGMEL